MLQIGVLYPAQSWVEHDRAVTAILGSGSPILESSHWPRIENQREVYPLVI
jgi:hypothetical protein